MRAHFVFVFFWIWYCTVCSALARSFSGARRGARVACGLERGLAGGFTAARHYHSYVRCGAAAARAGRGDERSGAAALADARGWPPAAVLAADAAASAARSQHAALAAVAAADAVATRVRA